MIAYAIRRILLIIPTLFAIMVVNFVIVRHKGPAPHHSARTASLWTRACRAIEAVPRPAIGRVDEIGHKPGVFRGTGGSNPVPSSGESANHRFLSGGPGQ